MEKFRPQFDGSNGLDLIFINTERFKFCVLAIDPERKVFITKSHGDLSDRIGAIADFGQLVFVDPESRLIGLHLYRGMLKIIPISSRNGNLQDAINLRLEELHVIDIKFLETQKPTVAVLYQDQREMRHVKTYEISIKEKEILEGPWNAPNVEVGASLLVPLKAPLGGVLLLGERSITYFNDNKSKSIAIKPMLIRAYAHIGQDASRMLFADHSGRLWLLLLLLSPDGKSLLDFKLELLGETSAAATLAYLDNNVVFIGSTSADSQLIRLCPEKDPSSGDYLQLLENYTNIGPIVDMTTVEIDRVAHSSSSHTQQSHQSQQQSTSAHAMNYYNASQTPMPNASQTQLVSCSGAFKDGSLRIIRNGIGIAEHAQLDLEGIQRVFALPSSDESSSDMQIDSDAAYLPAEKLLFLSYVSETRLLKISGEELEEVLLPGSSLAEPTLFASPLGTLPHLIVQITPIAVYVIDTLKKKQVAVWKPSSKTVASDSSAPTPSHYRINVATASDLTIALGVGSFTLQLLRFDPVSNQLKEVTAGRKMQHELSCISLYHQPHGSQASDSTSSSSHDSSASSSGGKSGGGDATACSTSSSSCEGWFVGVGQWNDNSVVLLKCMPSSSGDCTLTELWREEMGGEILPRSLVFASFEKPTLVHLLVGMGDGSVNSYVFEPSGFEESGNKVRKFLFAKKKMVLGRQPVQLVSFMNKGKLNVLACGDRPTVIYGRNGKVVFAPVNLPHVTSVCELNTREFPDALAFATKDALRIGSVDEIQRLHIQTIPLGEMARRVTHHAPSRSYLISSARYDVNDATGEETEVCSVKMLDDVNFDVLDSFKLDAHECAESIATVTFATAESKTYVVVGTGYVVPTELEPTKGRLLIFEVESFLLPSASSASLSSSSATAIASSQQKVVGKLKLVHEHEVTGMVWCMSPFANGKLIAGVAYAVQLYALEENREGVLELKLECEHTNHVQALCLATKDDLIYVGDLMRGTSLLQYKPVDSRLEQLAMDLRPNCILAVAILDSNCFLAAENSLNLLNVKYNSDPTISPDEREFLSPVGAYHLGDQPNGFRSGSLVLQLPDSDSLLLPSILYVTTSGAIGVIASLPKQHYDQLLALQTAFLRVIKGIGGFDHAEWRAYYDNRKTSPASNFIDGDLIESILDFATTEQDKLAKAAGMDTPAMIKLIESVSQATH